MAEAGVTLRVASGAVALMALCACAEGPANQTAGAGRLPPLRVFPGPLLLPAPGAARVYPRDTCGAVALAGLIGRPRTQIPVPVDLTRRRVACMACPVAPEVKLDRVNILFDAQTGIVTRITCG